MIPSKDSDGTVLRLGERTFPTCSLLCPPFVKAGEVGGESEGDVESRRLGGRSIFSMDYLVPAENGTVFSVEYSFGSEKWSLSIWSPVCWLEARFSVDDPMWLPQSLMVDTAERVLRPWLLHAGPWDWPDAEPEWIAESIDRWSRWPVVDVGDGPRAEIQPPVSLRRRGPGHA